MGAGLSGSHRFEVCSGGATDMVVPEGPVLAVRTREGREAEAGRAVPKIRFGHKARFLARYQLELFGKE